MRKIVLLLIVVFSMVLMSGCTDISDEFKKEVESTNSIMMSNYVKMIKSGNSGDYYGVINSAGFINRDSKEGRERIMAITNTNETLKNDYLSALRRIEDGSYTVSNINVGMILSSSNAGDTFYEAGRDIGNGMDKIMEVQSIWDESILDSYRDEVLDILI